MGVYSFLTPPPGGGRCSSVSHHHLSFSLHSSVTQTITYPPAAPCLFLLFSPPAYLSIISQQEEKTSPGRRGGRRRETGISEKQLASGDEDRTNKQLERVNCTLSASCGHLALKLGSGDAGVKKTRATRIRANRTGRVQTQRPRAQLIMFYFKLA